MGTSTNKLDYVVNLDSGFDNAMVAVHEILHANPGVRHKLSEIISELAEISYNEKDMSENRKGFLVDDPELKKKIYDCGTAIHLLGENLQEGLGFRLMQYVHLTLNPLLRGPSDGRTLEFAWDGIGNWRC